MSERVQAYFKITVAMMIVGSFVSLNKILTAHFPVFLVSEMRLFIGASIFIVLLIYREKRIPKVKGRDLLIMLLQALLGVFLFSVFLMYGLKLTTGIESGIITSVTPAVVGIISYYFLKEKLAWNQIGGIILSVIGTIVINVFGNVSNSNWSMHELFGNLLVLLAVIGEGVFLTCSKMISKELSSLAICTCIITFGALMFLPFALYEARQFDFTTVSLVDWGLVTYSGIIVTVLAVLLMNEGIKKIPGGTAAVFTGVMPISAVTVSCFILKETFYWYHAIGIVFVLLGILLISKQSRNRTYEKENVK
ncbi:putative transporter YetK [Paenibacillus marchantiophytorum]|uniref:Transporter YetK n=1 Tax=Paenibacillus marchantiophytorum TaxID=1619310 RepID=A0ABQ1EXP2_9BACL|nr:DMT family transporter [Paenibacillus marchantiophytorum]GFZ91883.1 putative transporter YetK [Paenibacillus marchantiophytorum]